MTETHLSFCCQEDGDACGPFLDQEREIEKLRAALKEIEDCYVVKFGGHVIGLNADIPMHRPWEIAHAALGEETS